MCVEWIIMNPGACMVIMIELTANCCRMDYYEPRSVYGDYDRTHSKLLQFANLHLIVMVKSVCL